MIHVYSAHHCPYAHRTRIVLEEKGIPYRLIEVDLKNKPAEFLKVSPYGKVPCIVDGDAVIYESAVINEYLDEKFPKPPLMPHSPEERARVRIWVDFANTRLFKASAIMKFKDPERGRRELMEHLETLNKEMKGREYLAGNFSLADISCAPLFTRLEDQGFNLGSLYPEVGAWAALMAARPSIAKTR